MDYYNASGSVGRIGTTISGGVYNGATYYTLPTHTVASSGINWSSPNTPNTWITTTPYMPSTITITSSLDTRIMKTTYLDDKFQILLDLAGFKGEEIKIKYLKESECCGSKPYIEIVAEAQNHAFKPEYEKTYKVTKKFEFQKDRELELDALTYTFVDGLLTIEIPYTEASTIKVISVK